MNIIKNSISFLQQNIIWSDIVFLFAGGAVIIGGWFFLRSRKKYDLTNWTNYTIAKEDNLKNLSEKFFIDWKILAKVNRIKPPYVLETGNVILVPLGKTVKESEKLNRIDAQDNFSDSAKTENYSQVFDEKSAKDSFLLSDFQANNAKEKISETFSYQSEKSSCFFLRYKYFLIIGAIIGVSVFAFGGREIFLKIKNEKIQKEKNLSIVSLNTDEENKNNQKTENTESLSVENLKENKNQEESEIINKSKLEIKVLNGGAPAGMAGKIKDYLIHSGYAKTLAANAEKDNQKGNIIFYQDLQFEKHALQIKKELLDGKKLIFEVKEAKQPEEKSAPIVIILGK